MLLSLFFIFLLIAAVSLWFYNWIEGVRLIRDAWVEFRLRRLTLQQAEAHYRSNPREADIVVCLTTIPSRIESIDITLKSLMMQRTRPRAIRLHIPRFSRREQCEYPVPERLSQLESITIVRCDDLGPATKLLPALNELPARQSILVVDDDRIYDNHMLDAVESMDRLQPDSAFSFSGWCVPPDLIDRPTTFLADLLSRPPVPIKCSRIRRPKAIDIVQGYSGYRVKPAFFDLDSVMDYSKAPEAAFYVDDVWISAHCQVDKFVLPAPPNNFLSYVDGSQLRSSSLGLINRGGGDNEKRNNTIMMRYFKERWLINRSKEQRP